MINSLINNGLSSKEYGSWCTQSGQCSPLAIFLAIVGVVVVIILIGIGDKYLK